MRLPTRGTLVAGKYELIEEIGRGGMGVVWRAYAKSLGLHCALKMVLPGLSAERDRARLLREAHLAAQQRSPYIVNTYDVGEWEGCAFIAMELLDGMPLSKWLAQSGTLSPEITQELVRQLALGLERAHVAGLVHRDLKPDNVFVVERDPLLVKLLDFGVAKQLPLAGEEPSHALTRTGAIIGTPRYMSPEQANGAPVDFRTDLWALAVIAFECLTGHPPFDGETWMQLLMNICTAPLPVPSQCRPGLPLGFDRFWATAAARDRTLRHGSAREFAEQMRIALSAQPRQPTLPPAKAPPSATNARRGGAPSRTRWAGIGLAVAAIGGGSGYALRFASPGQAALVRLPDSETAPSVLLPRAATSASSARDDVVEQPAALEIVRGQRPLDAGLPSASDARADELAQEAQPKAMRAAGPQIPAGAAVEQDRGTTTKGAVQPARRASRAAPSASPSPALPPTAEGVDPELGF